MSGGAIVMPIFHETIPVNMNTLKLEVSRAAAESLITRDHACVLMLPLPFSSGKTISRRNIHCSPDAGTTHAHT